jgi:hypothetical protein
MNGMTYYAHTCAVDCNDVLNRRVALGLVEAVSAGLVEGAECIRDEPSDVVFAAERIILEDLVLSIASSAADDAELGVQALGCECVFADVFPPDYRS